MLGIAQDYVGQYGWNVAVNVFVKDLMRGDPETFKAGYTRENAVIAASDAFDISRDEVEGLLT
ncbi:MAG TPA: hypothetical protein VNS88_04535 [Nitrospiraceae bacterium]|nr:hypothetical protein [Nitrospiraceae bacterium]